MDSLKKQASQRTQASKPTLETCCTTVVTWSELLEDAGNCRQTTHQVLDHNPLSDSLLSEKQKLRVALDWAQSFLSSTSDYPRETCRAATLKLTDIIHRETERTSATHQYSSSDKFNRSVNCTVRPDKGLGRKGTLEKVCQLEPLNYENSEQNNYLSRHKSSSHDAPPILFTLGRDDVSCLQYRETFDDFKSRELQLSTTKPTPSRVNSSTSAEHKSNPRHYTNISETFPSDAATCYKGATSCWSDTSKESRGAVSIPERLLKNSDSIDVIYESARSKEQLGNQKELKKEVEKTKVEEEKIEDGRREEDDGKLQEEFRSAFVASTYENMRYSEPEKRQEQMVKTENKTVWINCITSG